MKQFLIILILASCDSLPKSIWNTNSLEGEETIARVDTAKVRPYKVTSFPEVFERAYFTGTKAKSDTFLLTFYPVEIGRINIESGKIIACDPINIRNHEPFIQVFPKGHFPVQLAIAKLDNDERVAYSRIVFSEESVSKWEVAVLPGQQPLSLTDTSMYGYSVDAGLGLFIDEQANKAFSSIGQNTWKEVFIKGMKKNYRNTWDYTLHKFDGHNLAAFSTGLGDGSYTTYIGYDKNGNVCRLLTDFALVEWWKKGYVQQ